MKQSQGKFDKSTTKYVMANVTMFGEGAYKSKNQSLRDQDIEFFDYAILNVRFTVSFEHENM